MNSSSPPISSPISRLLAIALGLFAGACGQSESPSAPVDQMLDSTVGSEDTVRRPDLILVTIDSCRPDRTSAYGYGAETTPNLTSLASESLLFERAFSNLPFSMPAHATMLTGMLPADHGARDDLETSMHQNVRTLAGTLSAQNYKTAAFVGSLALHVKYGLNLGFDRYDDGMKRTVQYGLDPATRSGTEVVRLAGEWLEQLESDQPVFLFVNLSDARAPHDAQAGSDFENAYDAQIHAADDALGQLVSKLRELERYDDSLILVTSSNGEAFGEHGETGHGYSIYNSTLHVPLVLRVPGGGSQRSVASPVSLLDVAPTLLAAGGAPHTNLAGSDLRELVDQPQMDRAVYAESILPTRYERSPQFGLLSSDWKYIHSTEPELYNLAEDPGENNNLIASEPERASALQAQLDSFQTGRKLGGKAPAGFIDEHQLISSFPDLLESDCAAIIANCDAIEAEHGVLRATAYWRMQAEMQSYTVERTEKMIAHLKAFLVQYPARRKPAKARLEPFSSSACFQLGLLLVETGQGSLAIFPLRDALRSRPREITGQLAVGEAFIQIDRPTQAVSALQIASNIEDTGDLENTIGSIFAKNDGYFEALPHFEKAVELSPDNYVYQANLGRTYVAHQDWAAAVACYRTSLQLNPEQPEIEMELAYFLATTTDDSIKDIRAAVMGVDRALKGGVQQSVKILEGISAIYMEAKNYDLAIKFIGRALELARENRDALAVSQLQQQYTEALKISNELKAAEE